MKPRLLFLGQNLPYPPDGGVHLRMYHVMRLLSRTFDLTALLFWRHSERPTTRDVEAGLAGLGALGRVEAFPIPQEHHPARLLWDHGRSLLAGRAYTRYAYQSRAFRERLETLLRTETFDLAHVDSIDLAAYVPMLGQIPTVLGHHAVESILLCRHASVQRSAWRRAYLLRQAKCVEDLERYWCSRVALNTTVSPLDSAGLRRLALGGRFTVVPNGVDTDAFQPAVGRDEGLVFVGGSIGLPNRDGLDYFSADILPLMRAARPDLAVRWLGRCRPGDERAYRPHGIELTGYVTDPRPFIRDAACYIVPLRVGGGTRLKILDAWAMGKAVVSTSIGCEGLDARDGENILIRDTPRGFADAAQQVLADGALRQRLGRGGRETAERLYSWEVIGRDMLKEYESLIFQREPAYAVSAR